MTNQAAQATAHPRRHHQHKLRVDGIPEHVNDEAQAQTYSRSQPQTVMGANVPVVPTLADADSKNSDQVVYLHRPREQPNPRHWTCLHRHSIREASARRWTFRV